VHTIGELEVLDHLRSSGRCIDCRQSAYYAQGTLPGAVNIPHQHISARRDELDPGRPTVLFCNGPQCTATPAITALLAAGHPAPALLYYRGGIHDWVTLGLPLHQP
jgi:rhodanese-related sulfurtransferase